MTAETLKTRTGLPDALRVLVNEYPREAWEAHPNFAGLVQFWLDRHMMFRRIMAGIEADTVALLDRRTALQDFRQRLARHGSLLLGQLQEHHHVEDAHYFPRMTRLDARLERGFALLDRDHHALDDLMQGYAKAANAALAPDLAEPQVRARVGAFAETAARFDTLIGRHLEDEEDLIVPILLRYGAPGM